MTMISREQLYELVWSLPMSKAATQFEVSGSYLARVCAMLRVPRPERGYWAKLAVGKAPAKPPLPAIRFGDPFEWSKGDVIALVSAKPVASVPVMDEGIFLPSDMEKKRVRSVRREPVTGTHGLIQGARGHFENSRKVEEQQHLRPLKCLLVDVTASKGGLLKALSFANDLFNALETEGHRVTLASAGSRFIRGEIVAQEEGPPSTHYLDQLWSPMRPTITYIDEVGIGLAVVEMTEKVTMRYVDGRYIRDSEYVAPQRRWAASHTWTTEMNVPSGRMRLVAYAPYRGANWKMQWDESRGRSLTDQIKSIVKALQAATPDALLRMREAEREAAEAHQKFLAELDLIRRKEDQRQIEKARSESRAELLDAIKRWSEVSAVQRFLDEVEVGLGSLEEERRALVVERLNLARESLGRVDPLDALMSWKTPVERYRPATF